MTARALRLLACALPFVLTGILLIPGVVPDVQCGDPPSANDAFAAWFGPVALLVAVALVAVALEGSGRRRGARPGAVGVVAATIVLAGGAGLAFGGESGLGLLGLYLLFAGLLALFLYGIPIGVVIVVSVLLVRRTRPPERELWGWQAAGWILLIAHAGVTGGALLAGGGGICLS